MEINLHTDHQCSGSKITSTLTRATCYCGYTADVITDQITGSIQTVTVTNAGPENVTHSWSKIELDIEAPVNNN